METEGELIALGREGTPQIPLDEIAAAVSAMTMPVLIIHGTGDQIISYESAAELQERIPHASIITLEGAGHLPTGRYPVKINNADQGVRRLEYTHRRPAPAGVRRRSTQQPQEGTDDLVADRARLTLRRDLAIAGTPRSSTPTSRSSGSPRTR